MITIFHKFSLWNEKFDGKKKLWHFFKIYLNGTNSKGSYVARFNPCSNLNSLVNPFNLNIKLTVFTVIENNSKVNPTNIADRRIENLNISTTKQWRYLVIVKQGLLILQCMQRYKSNLRLSEFL